MQPPILAAAMAAIGLTICLVGMLFYFRTEPMKRAGAVVLRILLTPLRLPLRLWRRRPSIRATSPATKFLLVTVFVLAGVAGAGVFYATQSSVEPSASSAPFVSAVLEWATNGWGYVLAALLFGRGTVWGIRRTRIATAARETGHKPRTIARLADEIRTTSGTARAIVFGDDSRAEATMRILESFDGDDDRITFAGEATDADAAADSSVTIPDSSGLPAVAEVDESDPSNAERFKLWRMDVATGLRTDDVVWKFGVPAAVVLVVELILVQFWVQWWLYPPLVAGAVLAGLLSYKGDQWLRHRRLGRLRQTRTGDTWEEIAVLVKTVDADGLTVHMGFLAGRSYASTSRLDLAETLATRALERSHGYQPSPAIEERYAWCLDRYIPNFDGWRENMEKPAVMDQLVNEVLDSEEGMLPKEVLAQRVIEHDRRYIWRGLRFVGMGYDPDLVAECYEELVPNTLVEHDLTLRTPDRDRDVTAVRARTETLPPDVARLRAAFSDRFPVRKMPERYDLPGVEPDEHTRGFNIPTGD